MASQPLESLLTIVAASPNAARARNAESAPPRAGDDSDRFGPALDRALNSDAMSAGRRKSSPEGDAAAANDSANDDEAHAEATTPGEQSSNGPETDDDGAAEDSQEAAAVATAQAAPIVDAQDDARGIDAAAKAAAAGAAEAATDAQSAEDLPKSQERSATAAKEIGDVLPTPADGAKNPQAKPTTTPQGDASMAASSAAGAPAVDADVTSAADDAKLASPDADAKSGDEVDPTAGAAGTDDAFSENGGERDARATTPQRAIETPPIASIDAGVPTADAGAAPGPGEVPADQNAAQPATASSAAALARLSAGRTGATTDARGDGDGLGQADRTRFLGRVEGAIRTAQQRDGRVQVRLSPPELGSLRIELTVQNGVMSARLEAETSAARNLLLDNLPALRDRLAQQDIRVERFDVDVRRDGGGGGANQHEAQDRPTGDPSWRQGDQRREPRRGKRRFFAGREPRHHARRQTRSSTCEFRLIRGRISLIKV